MKNPLLAHLNFVELLNYGGQPRPQFRYESPLKCSGYCIDCERKGLAPANGKGLDKMSHGCDTSDYAALLGPLPLGGKAHDAPVMFLLEGPGGDYDLGEEVPYGGYKKRPPVKHYYWSLHGTSWPASIDDFEGNFYGPYFAYLMRKHDLTNVYITNATKCDWFDPKTGSRVRVDEPAIIQNCVQQWLDREISIHDPKIIFAFGRRAEGIARGARSAADSGIPVAYLYHPSAIATRSQTMGKTPQQMVDDNDVIVFSQIASAK